MHVVLHEIRRLSLLNYIYWWVRELFFRELDLKAFGILKCELVSRAVLDSEMNTEVCTEILLCSPYQQLHKQSDLFNSTLNSTFPLFLTLHRKRQFFNFKPLSLNSYWMISPGSCNTRCLLLRHREGAFSKLVFPYLVQETCDERRQTLT